jgi:hypothetical protein
MFEWTGRDFFTTDFSKILITLGVPGMSQLVEINGETVPQWKSINPVFNMAHGTLFNPNTYGKYTAMISPVLLLAGITYKGKKFVNGIFLFAGVLMLLGVVASDSLGGYVGIAVAMGVLILTLLCRSGKITKIIAISAGGVCAVLVIVMIAFASFFQVTIFDRMGQALRANTASINDYIFDGNKMTVTGGKGEIFSLEVAGLDVSDWLTVRDSYGTEILPVGAFEEEGRGQYHYDIPGYRRIIIDRYADMFLYHHETPLPFILSFNDGEIHALSTTMYPVDLQRDIPAWGARIADIFGRVRFRCCRAAPLSEAAPTLL